MKLGGWPTVTGSRTILVETPLGKVEQAERWCYGLQVRVADRDLRLDASASERAAFFSS